MNFFLTYCSVGAGFFKEESGLFWLAWSLLKHIQPNDARLLDFGRPERGVDCFTGNRPLQRLRPLYLCPLYRDCGCVEHGCLPGLWSQLT